MIFKLGLPAALQTGLFASIAMIIARIIARCEVHTDSSTKCWFSNRIYIMDDCRRFSTAISTFVGQNYGARKWDRIKEGYRKDY